MKDVKVVSGGATMIDLVTPPETVVIAKTAADVLFVVEKRISKYGKVLGLNLYPGNLSNSFWEDDGKRMIENLFQYACSIQFSGIN